MSGFSNFPSVYDIPVAVPIQPPLGFNQAVPLPAGWDDPRDPIPSGPPTEDLDFGLNIKGGGMSINKKRNYIKKKFIKTSKRIATTLRNFKKKLSVLIIKLDYR